MTTAFLGPRGTYSEQAAVEFAGDGADLLEVPNFGAAVAAVESGRAEFAVVPVENSIEGPVSQSLDILIHDTDLKLFAEIEVAIQHVLVGPEDVDFKNSKLHDLNNVFFLGFRKPEYLFQYINAFDICINPQLLNDLTIGNYPRKIDEYLAMGKPVVATKTETMNSFKEFVRLAENREEFKDMIEDLLINDNVKLRRQRTKFACSHTWENSVSIISRIVQEYRVRRLTVD